MFLFFPLKFTQRLRFFWQLRSVLLPKIRVGGSEGRSGCKATSEHGVSGSLRAFSTVWRITYASRKPLNLIDSPNHKCSGSGNHHSGTGKKSIVSLYHPNSRHRWFKKKKLISMIMQPQLGQKQNFNEFLTKQSTTQEFFTGKRI